MNEAMKKAWLEISQMLGYPTQQQQDVFLRTWQRAIEAEREACAKVADQYMRDCEGKSFGVGAAILARGNT
jgi:hypothetical protein